MADAEEVLDLRADRPSGRPCEWTTTEDCSCGAPSTKAVVIVGAGVSAELPLCPRHAAEVADLPTVQAADSHLYVLKWS